MSTLPKVVCTAPDAEMLVDWCLETIGLGYHPDTLAADYIDEAGRRTYCDLEATELDRLHDEAFASGFSEIMYAHGINGMRKIMGLSPVEAT